MAGELRSPVAGDHIGHYRLLELLGRDNALYFRASDTRSQRTVRLTISAGRFSPDEARRLLIDAQAATAVHHPNVSSVFEVGESERRVWIASEMVNGTTLEQLLRERGSLPMREAAMVASQIASGLAAAHGHGALHLGLRPGNVVIAGDSAKVIDLGAHALISSQGRAFATPALMAPEQVSGSARKADARTDIYSLGALLFQLLAGMPPFDGDTLQDIVRGILTKAPPQLRAMKPRAAPLEAIVNRTLEKKPEARFQTMTELAIALGEILRAPSSEIQEDPVYRVTLGKHEAPTPSAPNPAPTIEQSGGPRVQNTWVVASPASTVASDGRATAEHASSGGEERGQSAAVLQFRTPAGAPSDSSFAPTAGSAALAAPASTAPAFKSEPSAMTMASTGDGERRRITREVSGAVPTETPSPPTGAQEVTKSRRLLIALVLVSAFAFLAALGFFLR